MRAWIYLLPLLCFADDLTDLSVEKVAGNQKFTDGPVWSSDGFLLYCDVPSSRILKIDTAGHTIWRENSGGAAGLDYDAQGRLYAAEAHSRRITRTDKKGKLEVLVDAYDGKKLNAPNDIAVSKNGHLYFTDPAFGKQDDGHELPYSVYHVTSKGVIERVSSSKETRPNGIALSPDGKTLYVANSDERNIRAYDIAKDGSVSNERILVKNIDGPPGGLKANAKGDLYVAANKLAIYSADGKFQHAVELTERPSNLVFGDADRQTLYLTGRTSVYRIRLGPKSAVSSTLR